MCPASAGTTRLVWLGDGEVRVDYLELPDGHRVAVLPAPPWLAGTLIDVGALRAELGIIVVAIRRESRGEVPPRWLDPDVDRAVVAGDRLMVIATEDELARFQARGRSGTERTGQTAWRTTCSVREPNSGSIAPS